jgi:hypothetical protein
MTASAAPTPSAGTGLIGLRDRAEAAGGTLIVVSPAGRGTVVTASLPRISLTRYRRASRSPAEEEAMKPLLQEFKDFLMRGSLIELAVAFVMGTRLRCGHQLTRRQPGDADHRHADREARFQLAHLHDQ